MSRKIVEQIVSECIESEMPFTDFDIIPEAKARGCRLDKAKIMGIVQKVRYPIYYKRTFINIGNVLVDVYHPADFDPENYDSEDIIDAVQKSSKYKRISMNIDKVDYQYNCLMVGTKNKPHWQSRFTVPSYKIKEAGFSIGDRLHIKAYPDRIEIKNHGKCNKILKVDKIGRIRLTEDYFKRAFKKVPKSLSVVSNKGIVKILSGERK